MSVLAGVAGAQQTLQDLRVYHPDPAARLSDSPDLALGIALTQDDPAGESMARGLQLAIDQTNAAGGIRGRKLRFVSRTAGSRWGSAAEVFRDLLYSDDCLAILTPASGEAAHLAGLVAARGHVPILSLSPESSVTQIPVPWVFRVVPDTREEVGALAGHLPSGTRHVMLLAGPSRDDRVFLEDSAAALAKHGLAADPVRQLDQPLTPATIAAHLAESRRPTFVRNPASTALGLSGIELRLPPDKSAESKPTDRAVVEPILAYRVQLLAVDESTDEPGVAVFAAAYRAGFGVDPDEAAARGYDAAMLAIHALAAAKPDEDLDRVSLRAGLLADPPADSPGEPAGVTGMRRLNEHGVRVGEIRVAGFNPNRPAEPAPRRTP